MKLLLLWPLNLSLDLEFNFIPYTGSGMCIFCDILCWFVRIAEHNGLIAPTPSLQQVVVNRHNNTAIIPIRLLLECPCGAWVGGFL